MKIINKLNRYLEETNCKIVIQKNSVNITNVDEIIDFSLNSITIKNNQNTIIIEGKNLIISKMEDDEILIRGTIYNVRIN